MVTVVWFNFDHTQQILKNDLKTCVNVIKKPESRFKVKRTPSDFCSKIAKLL